MRVLVVTNMYPTPAQPAFGTFVHDQVEALRNAGVDIDVLFINGRQSKLNYLLGIVRLWHMLARKRYDLIHAHYALSGFIARWQFLYPVIVTYHGSEIKDHTPFWLREPARRAPRIFNRVIVMNETECARLKRPNVRVIPCGVNLDEFKPLPQKAAREALGLPLTAPLILWAGEYWQREKRYELVKASFDILKHQCPEAELLLISGKPHATMPPYMNAADAFVFTSFSEGSPMVIKEAMACNLPIVSTDAGDIAQVIGGVDGCYLVAPDADAIADKLLRVIETRQRTRGREHIQHLSADAITRRLIALYNELCPQEHRIDLPDARPETLQQNISPAA